MKWYVLRTKSRHEKSVFAEATNRSIACYLPQTRHVRDWRGRKQAVEFPVFPGYLFVKPETEQIRELNYIPGSCGLIRFSDGPGTISDREIENIRILTESRVPFEIQDSLQNGDRVIIRSGPLKGVEGELVRQKAANRLVLNAFILGKSLCVEIGMADVECIASGPSRN
jgi:transcription antitermination factor NusG